MRNFLALLAAPFTKSRRGPERRRGTRLCLECLEERQALSTLFLGGHDPGHFDGSPTITALAARHLDQLGPYARRPDPETLGGGNGGAHERLSVRGEVDAIDLLVMAFQLSG